MGASRLTMWLEVVAAIRFFLIQRLCYLYFYILCMCVCSRVHGENVATPPRNCDISIITHQSPVPFYPYPQPQLVLDFSGLLVDRYIQSHLCVLRNKYRILCVILGVQYNAINRYCYYWSKMLL